MNTDEKRPSECHCACGHAINRRRFLAVGSGCVLGVAGAASGVAAEKIPTVDIGSPKKFTEEGVSDEFTKDDFFVIRYQDKLFAASTTCPHMGGILQRDPQDSKRVSCGIHGSVFDTEGIAIVGPASTGLVRFGVSMNKEGHVIVDPNKQFPQDKWTDKGCYIEVK